MKTILTDEFARELNGLHIGLQKSARLLISEALVIGEKLVNAEKNCNPIELREWMDGKLDFTRRTAYKYIDLYKFQKQIKDAENLTEAYKLIEGIKSEKKQAEIKQSADRVEEYKETGIKPEGYKRMTDERRAHKVAQNESIQNVQKGKSDTCQTSHWKKIFQSRLLYADEDQNVANLFESMNEFDNDDERVEFMQNCIKAFNKAIAEMDY
jgi:hypothetical protein